MPGSEVHEDLIVRACGGTRVVRVGIVGCGRAARIHAKRIAALPGVAVVGCADLRPESARSLAEQVASSTGVESVASFSDHRSLLEATHPDAVAIFTPHPAHYRPAMDALQENCHLFVERPLSTSPQEALDLVKLARARGRIVGVGHQYRLRPSIIEAKRRISSGSIGTLRLVSASLVAPWLAIHSTEADAWRNQPKLGGGILADLGDHLLDAMLWTAGQPASEVAAFQHLRPSGLDLVTAATIRLADGTPAILGLSALGADHLFELDFHGELATLRVTEHGLTELGPGARAEVVELASDMETIDGNFFAALAGERPLCCPAEQALDTVRLIDAITRSATENQVVRLA